MYFCTEKGPPRTPPPCPVHVPRRSLLHQEAVVVPRPGYWQRVRHPYRRQRQDGREPSGGGNRKSFGRRRRPLHGFSHLRYHRHRCLRSSGRDSWCMSEVRAVDARGRGLGRRRPDVQEAPAFVERSRKVRSEFRLHYNCIDYHNFN